MKRFFGFFTSALLFIGVLAGCANHAASTSTSGGGVTASKALNYQAETFTQMTSKNSGPFSFLDWSGKNLPKCLNVQGNKGVCTAAKLASEYNQNKGPEFTEADTPITFSLTDTGAIASVSYAISQEMLQKNQTGVGSKPVSRVASSLCFPETMYDYGAKDKSTDGQRMVLMIKDSVLELTDDNPSAACVVTYYSFSAYEAKYPQDYAEEKNVYLRDNQMLRVGSIAANQLGGGLMVASNDGKDCYYTDVSAIWLIGKAEPIVRVENPRFLNLWDGKLYYMAGSNERFQATGSIYAVNVTGTAKAEAVVSDVAEYMTGFWIRDGILY